MANKNTNGYDDEEMTVELELDDGQMVNCAIITILTVDKKDYIVLLPLDEDDRNVLPECPRWRIPLQMRLGRSEQGFLR